MSLIHEMILIHGKSQARPAEQIDKTDWVGQMEP